MIREPSKEHKIESIMKLVSALIDVHHAADAATTAFFSKAPSSIGIICFETLRESIKVANKEMANMADLKHELKGNKGNWKNEN